VNKGNSKDWQVPLDLWPPFSTLLPFTLIISAGGLEKTFHLSLRPASLHSYRPAL